MQFGERRFYDITASARDIASGDIDSAYTPSNSPNPERVDLYRRERFAIGAVIVERIVDRSFKEYFNNIEEIAEPASIEVSPLILNYLDKSASSELNYLQELSKNQPDNPWAKMYDRYVRLTEIETSGEGLVTPKKFVMVGVEQALQAMDSIRSSVDHVYEEKTGRRIDGNTRKQIMQNSFGLVSNLASMFILDFNQTVVSNILDDPSSYELLEISSDGGFMMIPSQQYLDNSEATKSDELLRLERMRCPGLVSFDGKPSAIKRLWDLYVSLS